MQHASVGRRWERSGGDVDAADEQQRPLAVVLSSLLLSGGDGRSVGHPTYQHRERCSVWVVEVMAVMCIPSGAFASLYSNRLWAFSRSPGLYLLHSVLPLSNICFLNLCLLFNLYHLFANIYRVVIFVLGGV